MLRTLGVWASVWTPLVLVAAAHAVAFGQMGDLLHYVFLFGVGGLCLLFPAPVARVILVTALLATTASFVVEQEVAMTTWASGDTPALSRSRLEDRFGPARIEGSEGTPASELRWTLANDAAMELSFEARLADGVSGWTWVAGDPAFVLAPVPELGPGYTQVTTPTERVTFITRRLDTGSPVAGRTFRVSLALQLEEAASVPASVCQGVVLREAEGSQARGCFAGEFAAGWSSHSYSWTVPATATSDLVAVELRLPVERYVVGEVRLEEETASGWEELGPLFPAGLQVTAIGAEGRRAWAVDPTDAWQRFTLPFEVPAGALRLLLRPEAGTVVEVRGEALTSAAGATQRSLPLPPRRQSLFVHANVAGAVLALLGVAMAGWGRDRRWVVAAAAMAVVGIGLTGSRTGMVALVVGWGVLLLARAIQRPKDRPALTWVLVAMLAAAYLAPMFLARGLSAEAWQDGSRISRAELAAFALGVVRESPLAGLGGQSFPDRWNEAYPEAAADAPEHAHNVWLQLGVLYGLPGLVAGLWVTGASLLWGVRRSGWMGLAWVVTFWTLQLTDFTFLQTAVFVCFMVGLNAMAVRGASLSGEAPRHP